MTEKKKLHLVPAGCVPVEQMHRNIALCRERGLPKAGFNSSRKKLAVVGGGASARAALEVLRAWDGDIWACGSAWQWLNDEGIDSILFCVDPQPGLADMARGARKALLASNCDPSAFDVLQEQGASIEVFDLVDDNEGIHHGPTTASTAFDLSVKMGYLNVSMFGFDSCYAEGAADALPERIRVDVQTHAYKTEPENFICRVVCDGKAFITCGEFLMQAQWMAEVFRALPLIFTNRSGGLMAAMIADPDYDCTHVSTVFAEKLQEAA